MSLEMRGRIHLIEERQDMDHELLKKLMLMLLLTAQVISSVAAGL